MINSDEERANLTAAEHDTASPVWDMSQERAFVENLLNQRFNFFLVFFSLVVAGSVNAKTQVMFDIILGVGAVIGLLFTLVLSRTQQKLELILEDLFTDKSHPATIIDRRTHKLVGSRLRFIGFYIP